jgi:hypothetical protein
MTSPCDSRGFARLFALVGFLLLASGLPALAAPIGEVIAIGGSPEASGPGGERGLQAGSAVFEGDRITTGYGNAQILFVDETKLVVGPNSTLVIDRFLLRGDKRATKVSLDALRGTFRFISGNSDKEAYEIETGNATIGIRGTAFDFSSRMTTVVAMFAGYTTLSTGSDGVDLGPHCDVGRAAFGSADPYDGRAAGTLIVNNLPYVIDQSSLDPLFRVDTSDCAPKVNLLEKGRRHNDRNENRGGGNGGEGGEGGNGGNGGGGSTGGDPPNGGNSDPPGRGPGGGSEGGGGGGGTSGPPTGDPDGPSSEGPGPPSGGSGSGPDGGPGGGEGEGEGEGGGSTTGGSVIN